MKYVDRDEGFEAFLDGLNQAVGSLPAPALRQPVPPSAQITGLPRSGTTLLYQLMARSGAVGYPSNVMALFHQVPWVGARLQVQLAATDPTLSTRSVGGRTPEPLDPHEFGYFWRRVCGHSANSLHQDRGRPSTGEIQRELDLVASVFGKPVVYKNFLALAHTSWMLAELEGMHLVVVHRPLLDVAASLIQLRRHLGTSRSAPLGVQPGRVDERGTVEDGVARQVIGLAARLSDPNLATTPRVETVSYRELCERPREVVSRLLGALGCPAPNLSRIPDRFEVGAGFEDLDNDDRQRLVVAMEKAEETFGCG